MTPHYIKGSQYIIFQALRESTLNNEPVTQNKIAQQTGYDPRTVNRAILVLEELGYIRVTRGRGRQGHKYQAIPGVQL